MEECGREVGGSGSRRACPQGIAPVGVGQGACPRSVRRSVRSLSPELMSSLSPWDFRLVGGACPQTRSE